MPESNPRIRSRYSRVRALAHYVECVQKGNLTQREVDSQVISSRHIAKSLVKPVHDSSVCR